MRNTVKFRFSLIPNGPAISLAGRDAWALQELIRAGAVGCTPIDTPGPRWSAYVYNLRQIGLEIETLHEPHDGPFAGSHARYILRSRIYMLAEA